MDALRECGARDGGTTHCSGVFSFAEVSNPLKRKPSGSTYPVARETSVKLGSRTINSQSRLMSDSDSEFGPFRLDPKLPLLSCDEDEVKLQPQAVKVLRVLVSERDKRHPKESILKAAWGDDTHVDARNVVSQVWMIKKALKDACPGFEDCIVGESKVGYMFSNEILNRLLGRDPTAFPKPSQTILSNEHLSSDSNLRATAPTDKPSGTTSLELTIAEAEEAASNSTGKERFSPRALYDLLRGESAANIQDINTPTSISLIADGNVKSALAEAESLEYRGKPLAAESLLQNHVTQREDSQNVHLNAALSRIRRRNILEFFNPHNNLPTVFVFDTKHRGRTDNRKESTTDAWRSAVEQALLELARISHGQSPKSRRCDDDPRTIHELVTLQKNLVTYASSKINPCADDILEEMNRLHGLDLRFLYEKDVGRQVRSTFTSNRKSERISLVFGGKPHKSEEVGSSGRDYGILLRYRFPEENGRQWIIFAGSSRTGSVAARLLVFDREFGQQLWTDHRLREPLESFLAVFEVSYTSPADVEPERLKVLEFRQWLDSKII